MRTKTQNGRAQALFRLMLALPLMFLWQVCLDHRHMPPITAYSLAMLTMFMQALAFRPLLRETRG